MGDVKFIQTISDILNPSMFDSDSNKWLVKTIKDYYYEYKKQPTLEVIKYKIDEIEDIRAPLPKLLHKTLPLQKNPR